MLLFRKNIYLCNLGGFRQLFPIVSFKSLSSFFSLSGSSGKVFLCNNPDHKPGLHSFTDRSVFKAFDCVGLTKPQSISKLLFICYLRFYAAILSNVVKLTTLRKQSQMVFSQYLKWQLTCKSSIDNKPAFCLVSVVKKSKKNLFFALPLYKRGF